MVIRATVLCENLVFGNVGALAEHGWSVLIETNNGNCLLDTGQGKSIINNFEFFKVTPKLIEGIILSHHHIDHTGGLLEVLKETGSVDVYAHPELFKDSYSLKDGKTKHIGIPHSQIALEEAGANFKFNTKFLEIAQDMFITGEIPRRTYWEKGDKNQVIKIGDSFEQDQLLDDQSVVIKSKEGLFVILGCAHSGIINTLDYMMEKTGEDKIHTVIGGTHLGMAEEEQVDFTIEALKKMNISRLGVSHCTGLKASVKLANEFGEKFFFCNVGSVVEL